MMESIRRDDYGFFGPDSPSWKVWASPTSLIGFQRSVVLEHFDPFLAAAVADSAGIYSDPSGRLDRTLAYFLTVAVADGRTAVAVSDALMRIHARAKGIEPITGARYSANNPEAQLWIHVTGWHSVLKCYERYGPGPLSAAEEMVLWQRGERRFLFSQPPRVCGRHTGYRAGCACRKSNSHIQMMKSAKKWRRQNATNGMYGSRRRRVLVE